MEFVQVLIIIASLALFVVFAWVIWSVINLKNTAVRCAKRLYERPLRSFNNLTTAGKGLIQQETVRVQNAGKNIKAASDAVNACRNDVQEAVDILKETDFQVVADNIQSAVKMAAAVASVMKTASSKNS